MKDFKYSVYRRRESSFYWIRRSVPGHGELRLSTRTTSLAEARKLDYLVCELRKAGRTDALVALLEGRVTLRELDLHRDAERLNELLARTSAPILRPLVEEWLEHGASDTGVRDSSMRRYRASWQHVWSLLPDGARVSDLNQQFVVAFKRYRIQCAKAQGKVLASATLNRDLAAIGAFLSWCDAHKMIRVNRPRLAYHEESRGKTRWLTSEELAAIQSVCPTGWWALFGLMATTGLTIGEALGLRVSDVNLSTGRVSVHEEHGRKLKRTSRARELSIPNSFLPVLSARVAHLALGPMDRMFGFTYWPARKAWRKACGEAGVIGASLHDLRHTFAVHAVMSGIPESRLQKLLGHSHPGTTRIYTAFAPGSFVQEDCEAVASSLQISGPRLRLDRAG